jgi:hypothetical protein
VGSNPAAPMISSVTEPTTKAPAKGSGALSCSGTDPRKLVP